nr:hypothetical protein [Tanacetum cinerariifolium]
QGYNRVTWLFDIDSLTKSINYVPLDADILGVESSSDEAIVVEADVSNMETSITASPTPTLRILKDHPKSQIISPVDTPIQTKHKSKVVEEQKPKKISDALQDPCWVEAMQEELLQFKIQNVWTLVNCPKGRIVLIAATWMLREHHLCFYYTKFRLNILFGCVTLVIRGNVGRPMRLRDCARWDKGHRHMGCWGNVWKCSGEVQVYRKVVGKGMGE